MGQSSGLRFDIFERVHIAETAAEIQDLEEIELVPQIELDVKDTYATLSGHLALRGSYSSQERSAQQLEHRIPVEIAMPLNRIQNSENIGVEIENFDVELLSARTLNVTGVLSLSGLKANSTDEVTKAEEEKVFVHEKQADTSAWVRSDASSSAEQQGSDPVKANKEELIKDKRSEKPVSESKPSDADLAKREKKEQQPAQANTQPVKETDDQPTEAVTQPVKEADDQPAEEADVDLNEKMNDEQAQATEAQDESESEAAPTDSVTAATEESTEEVKIAFSKQKDDETNAFITPSKLMSDRPEAEAVQAESEVETAPEVEAASLLDAEKIQSATEEDREHEETDKTEPSSEERVDGEADEDSESTANGLEWKKLFLNQEDEVQTEFSRLKMCIVQKDETLESIAERYELNPREILLYNRLNDQTSLSEGQVIYIPQLQT